MRNVYVTGMAIWSPFGRGTEAFWNALCGDVSGVAPVTRFATDHWVYRTKSGAVIGTIAPEDDGADEESARAILDAVIADLFAASSAAADDASPYRTGVYVGSSQNVNRTFRDHIAHGVEASLAGEHLSLSPARLLHQIAAAGNARGAIALVSTACASGTSSVGLAFDAIGRGRLDRAFAGGIGHFSQVSFSGFNILRLTTRTRCAPFSKTRDGMILGDGYALLLLESEELVLRRRAAPIARIVGYGSGNEAYHPTAPQPDGNAAYNVMWSALGRSMAMLDRLDYINAHGTGTPAHDRSELTAIDRLLQARNGGNRVAISSTKGHHGHSLGAAGSVELVATLLAMQHGMAPPTLTLSEPEPGFEHLCLVREHPLPQPIRVALSNSLAFGGNIASIAVESLA